MSDSGISSQEFKRQLNEFNEQQKKQRHESHSRVMGVLMEQGKETTIVHDRIDRMEITMRGISERLEGFVDSMNPFAELAKDLKGRLFGDPNMRTTGLVDDHEQLKKTIEERLKAIEATAKNNGEETRKARKEQWVAIWGAAGTFITTIGLIVIAWLNLKK